MGLFSNNYEDKDYNIYSMKKYVNKKLIVFNIIMIILIIVVLCIIIYLIMNTKFEIEKNDRFVSQIMEYKSEQEKIEKQKEIERLSKIPNYTDEGKENIKYIYKSESKRAYLTFDDGPSQNTNDILDILNENNIKATFFVLGCQVQSFPETTNKIYKEGHYIANHGYSHKYSEVYSSPEEVLNEYNRCNQIVSETIGIPEYNSHLFRFPGGSVGGKYEKIKKEAISILDQNNIAYVDWNALTGDSEKVNPSEEYLMSNLQNTTNEKNSVVILMHDSQAKRVTVDFLPKAIEYLKQQGYEFENFYSVIK